MNLPISLPVAVLLTEIFLTIALIGWLRRTTHGQPTEWKSILTLLFFGILAAIVSGFVVLKYSFDIQELSVTRPELVDQYKSLMQLINVFSASAIEELAKYFIGVFFLVLPKHSRPHLTDTIVSLIIVGLGFALIEDVFYLLQSDSAAPFRLMSFFVHSGTSAVIGYSLGRFRFGLTGYRELAVAIVSAISLHMMYNVATQVIGDPQIKFTLLSFIALFISLQIFILFRRAYQEEIRLQKNRPKPKPATKLLNL